MSRIVVFIEDKIRDERVRVTLDADTATHKLVDSFIEQYGLPRRDFDLTRIKYHLVRAVDETRLPHNSTLGEVGIVTGELLQLVSPAGRRVWRVVQKLLDEIEDEIIDRLTGDFKEKVINEVWGRLMDKLDKIEKTQSKGDRVQRFRDWVDRHGGPTKFVEAFEELNDAIDLSRSTTSKGAFGGFVKTGLSFFLLAGAVIFCSIILPPIIDPPPRTPPPEPPVIVAPPVQLQPMPQVESDTPQFVLLGDGELLYDERLQTAVLLGVPWQELDIPISLILGGQAIDSYEVAYDPEVSLELLAEAGFPEGFELLLFYPYEDEELNYMAEVIADTLTGINIYVGLTPISAADMPEQTAAIMQAGETYLVLNRQ